MNGQFANESRKPVRADFKLQVDEAAKRIQIIDEDLGNMSVTNDMEAVLREVSLNVDLPLSEYSIVYRDSTGTWDRIIVTAHEALAHTWRFVVRPGPDPDVERRDQMVVIHSNTDEREIQRRLGDLAPDPDDDE